MTNTQYLQSLHTKQLMNLRDQTYATDEAWEIVDGVFLKISREEILAELNTREHVPNKKEAKEIRRQKMKERQNR